MYAKPLLAFGVIATLSVALSEAQIPAFPGAEGFGSTTPGGRGGKVLIVNTLDDEDDGSCDSIHCSLREALQTDGPRIVLFSVGGTITVARQIHITKPFLTVAGQSAPGDGITLRIQRSSIHGPLKIRTHDVVMRHLRSRPGPGTRMEGESNDNIDAITIAMEGRESGDETRNIVIDHCSFTWATDEVVGVWFSATDITLSWNIIAEGLNRVPGNAIPHSKGVLIGSQGAGRISFHHNLLSQNRGRNPLVKISSVGDFVNNVMHCPYEIAAGVSDEFGGWNSNWVGNFVQSSDERTYGLWQLGGNKTRFYLKDNIGPYRTALSQPDHLWVRNFGSGRRSIVATRFAAPHVTTMSPFAAFDAVLQGVGATLPKRDAIDERIVGDVRAKKYRIIDSPGQVGGWIKAQGGPVPTDSDRDGMPDAWEMERFGTTSRGPNGDYDGDGYTDLEEYLNEGISIRPAPPMGLRLENGTAP